jgi:site-specific DNA-methyltransferase (adenine-specific)/site-specific DNA-methyltransferase (cytosine-N4-specific)
VLVVVSVQVHAEQNTFTKNAIGVTQKTRVPKLTMKRRKDMANKDKNMLKLNTIYWGDSLVIMSNIASKSIDMIFTSPPYADRRKSTYGGAAADKYIEWFLPFAKEFKRILKPSGSFFLNIKPHTAKGERVLYVFDLVCKLKREVGLKFVDEYCWTKNPFPGKLSGRFKNAFEPVYHFSVNAPNKITFNPLACGTPMKPDSIARAYRKQCGAPANGSGMSGMNTTNIRHLKLARPSNVVNVNNVSNQFTDKQLHPATFPEGLVEFFVKSFTNENDIVLDPFAGSGTTGLVCRKHNRKYLLIDKEMKYCQLASKRISQLGNLS